MNRPHLQSDLTDKKLNEYQAKFKALADTKRLRLLNLLSLQGETCVCDLTEDMEMSQSKLSYHLKIMVEANLLNVQAKGKWSYYSINESEVDHLLSENLCCVLKPSK